MEIYPFNFSTEYYQFYLLDSKTKAKTDANDFWCPAADKRRLAIGEGLLGVNITTYDNVTGSLYILLKKPEIIATDVVKHIVEASIRIPSSILQLKNCTGYETQLEVPIEKGTYRVRITTQNIEWASYQKSVWIDQYIIEMWKSNYSKPVILKTQPLL